MTFGRHTKNVPLHAGIEFAKIDAQLDFVVVVLFLADVLQIDLVTVVRPRAELHEARLLVEWKVAHVDFARRFKDGRRRPDHFAGVVQHGLCQRCDDVLAVGADFSWNAFNIMVQQTVLPIIESRLGLYNCENVYVSQPCKQKNESAPTN